MPKLYDWFKGNKLSLNVKKSNYVIFKPRQRREEFDLNIEINGHKMIRVKEVTFLGVIFDENLSWQPHISHIAGKISKSVGIIGRSSPCLTKLALKTLYYSLVYAYFQYCIIVWGSAYPNNLNRLILQQKRIVRIVNKMPFDAHTDPLFRDLKFVKFVDIYSLHLGKVMYSYKNKLLPLSFRIFFFLRTNQVHSYNTRGSNRFYIPFCRNNISKFSIIYQGPVFLNKLCSDIRNALSLYSFQSKIKNYLLSCY